MSRFYLLTDDWTWWIWVATIALLIIGLAWFPYGVIAAIALTALQLMIVLARERSLTAFPAQLRLTYALILLVSYPPGMRWRYWLPTLETLALILFGYCFLARVLSLLPWHREERLSNELLYRTFFSAPDRTRAPKTTDGHSCLGGLRTIEVRVRPAD